MEYYIAVKINTPLLNNKVIDKIKLQTKGVALPINNHYSSYYIS